jgi:leucyl/phenylalanyl-tRNA--protein transferase
MVLAYKKLHDLGFAHSVEYWKNGKLAGGLYGIAIGGLFAGESMFYKEPNASKLALIALVERMKVRGFTLLDCQMVTEATKRFGAIEISRKEYLRHLGKALSEPCKFV